MKVIKSPKLKLVQCKHCSSVLKIKHTVIERSVEGYKYIICPVCGHWNVKEDNELFEGAKNERN